MSNYLKFYFGYDGIKPFFNSVVCVEGVTPTEPDDFLKWYEDGDFAAPSFTEGEKEAIAISESPVFATMFAPREVTFSMQALIDKVGIKQ